jgi:hypothetical protein
MLNGHRSVDAGCVAPASGLVDVTWLCFAKDE